MRKKTREKVPKFLSIFLLLAFIISLVPTIVHAEGYSSFLNQYMSAAQSAINTAKSSPTDENMQKAIDNNLHMERFRC